MNTRNFERKLYRLSRNFNDPAFEGFAFSEKASVLGRDDIYDDFLPDDCGSKGLDWTTQPLAEMWRPRAVVGRVRNKNDFPSIGWIPAFSQRAVDTLGDLLEENGELLPLDTNLGNYYAFNTLRKADIVDLDRSEINWGIGNKAEIFPYEIDRLSTSAERLEGLSIFRIPQDIMQIYVTDIFVSRVVDSNLNGFEFAEIWPGTGILQLAESNMKESVIVRLARPPGLSKNKLKSTTRELVKKVGDFLYRPISEYLGSLEDAEFNDDEIRLFFSCPDSSYLALTLEQWTNSLEWSGQTEVIMRKGSYTDSSAVEKVFKSE